MLYQKVRPRKLDQVRGNKQAVVSLRNAMEANDRSHCYLLHGPSGCGKTTLAQIAATELGCGNVVMKNASSERGIDMARELERFAASPPITGGKTAIILDEAHALTRDAQNALLKQLEDTPEWLYFFLCSTEPSKLLNTIRTRAQHTEVGPLRDEDMANLLLDAIEVAGINIPSDDVLEAITERADGCPRTALVLLEQQQGMKEEEAIEAIAGYKGHEAQLIEVLRAVAASRWKDVKRAWKNLDDKSNPEKIRYAALGYLKSCLIGAKTTSEAEAFADKMEELSDPAYQESLLIMQLFRATQAGK